MDFYWIYDTPSGVLGLLLVLLFAGGGALGLWATREPVRRLFGPPPGHNDVVSYYVGAFGVFYGLTLGLIAVATWQNFADLERLVAEEAAALRVLDMNVTCYPSPQREDLHRRLLAYADFVIEEEWPAQRRGLRLAAAQQRLLDFGRPLAAFEPATAGQEVLHEETVRSFARYYELRRQRVFSVSTGLPATVWYVLLVGAGLSIALTFLFSLSSPGGHLVLTVTLSGFVGLLVFLIAAMDHPHRGEFSVGPAHFGEVRRQMELQLPAALTPLGW